MSDDTADAWAAVRRRARQLAEAYDSRETDAVAAVGDFGGVGTDEGTPVVAVTVGRETADALAGIDQTGTAWETTVHYADTADGRLLLVEAVAADRSTAVVFAGGVGREALRSAVAEPDDPLRTELRRLDGTVVFRLRHGTAAPFLEELGD